MQMRDEAAMDKQFAGQIARWLIAGIIACVALVGIVLLVGALVVALNPPLWIAVVAGTVLAVAAAAFAWLVATALGSRSEGHDDDRVHRLPRD
ncbi:MAG TPA: hypothetical protein VM784_05715 [Actinomycetota bacterium]|nr:hypothetical protein [Actinomycetota bacterium]